MSACPSALLDKHSPPLTVAEVSSLSSTAAKLHRTATQCLEYDCITFTSDIIIAIIINNSNVTDYFTPFVNHIILIKILNSKTEQNISDIPSGNDALEASLLVSSTGNRRLNSDRRCVSLMTLLLSSLVSW